MSWSTANVWIYGLFMAALGGFVYLVRTIFTNQTELKILRTQLEMQDQYRRDRDSKMDAQFVELRSDIKVLMHK